MSKLHEVIAVEKREKATHYGQLTAIHKLIQRTALFNGFNRHYEDNRHEGGDNLPPESQRVQHKTKEVMRDFKHHMIKMMNVCARREWSNLIANAKANIVVDGVTLVEDVPVTYLIFLEKQMNDLHDFVSKLPVLDPTYEWEFSPTANLFATPETSKHRTKKNPIRVVKFEPTQHHPGQAEIINDDVIVGHWKQINYSGAMEQAEKDKLLERVEKLRSAVTAARERANDVEEAEIHPPGERLLSYVFNT